MLQMTVYEYGVNMEYNLSVDPKLLQDCNIR